jgi:dienelactone hydrolase
MRIIVLALILINFLYLAVCPASAETVELPGPDGIVLRAVLHRPDGPPIAPAIVALHGCGGPYPSRDAQWTDALTRAGHIVLFPDSFASRGLHSQCRVPERDRPATSGGLRRRDAIAAATWLAAQPGTPPGGIVLLGWSDGGSTVLATARAGRDDVPPGLFRAFIAFYPGCHAASITQGWHPLAPLNILQGESDDWTPIAPCRALAATAPDVTLTAYPGAYHDFDAPVPLRVMRNIPSSQNPDHTVHAGGNDAARADALARVLARLAAPAP